MELKSFQNIFPILLKGLWIKNSKNRREMVDFSSGPPNKHLFGRQSLLSGQPLNDMFNHLAFVIFWVFLINFFVKNWSNQNLIDSYIRHQFSIGENCKNFGVEFEIIRVHKYEKESGSQKLHFSLISQIYFYMGSVVLALWV